MVVYGLQLKELKEESAEGSSEKHVDRFKAAAEFWRGMPQAEKDAITQKFKVCTSQQPPRSPSTRCGTTHTIHAERPHFAACNSQQLHMISIRVTAGMDSLLFHIAPTAVSLDSWKHAAVEQQATSP